MKVGLIGYPLRAPGQISVTASKEEWELILNHMYEDATGLTEGSKGWELVLELRKFGVE